ncbi:EAL domain-containing protein [Neptunomonas antarctica]|uniref:cyclic-guanylate-specific phosphodiesterase n=1 Tax=Neptunomonas antarctica TaxID=619304 RepID=A0A1N7MW63_9GAMM|nr:EAL domain-containing protein [Neptunomonas antarctica]SIS90310.1 diguanylate cyclase (GGDEF) domain-containing protein [Neptunomonas antarctica]
MVQSSLKSDKHFTLGIGLKLGILLALFGILTSGLTGYYTFNTTRDILLKKATQNMITSAQVLGERFSSMGQHVSDDALFFAQTSLVQQAADDIKDVDLLRASLADEFISLLSVHSEYFQVRLISAKKHGIELVRVDRDEDKLTIITGKHLQEKKHYSYVYKTLKLEKGKTYFSEIFINHEKGAHTGYDQPTLQVATPVIGKDGIALGLIVINVNLNQMFKVLKSDLSSQHQLYLTNQAGDYLIHPDKSRTFGFDLGLKHRVQDDFISTLDIVSKESQAVAVQGEDPDIHQKVIGGFTQVVFGEAENNRFVILGLTAPLDFILAETNILYRNGSLIVGAFSCLAIILFGVLAKIVIRPIKQLVRAVQQFTDNQKLTPIAVNSKDEIGLLAGSIGKMQAHILNQLNDLNEQNKVLNQEVFEREKIERYEKYRSYALELVAKKEPLGIILHTIVEGVELLKPKILCSILLLDKEGQHLGVGAAPSLPEFYNAAIDGIEIGVAVGSCGTAAFMKQRVIVEDIQTHLYWADYQELAQSAELRSCWSQPIFSSTGQVLGTFAIYHRAISVPTESDLDVIEQSARLASIAIEHKQIEEEINNLAFYDSLTLLPNRRLLLDRLKQTVASMAHNKKGASLLFIDLDKFKTLNDSYGHEMGDQLLKQVAQRLSASVRESDTVSRLSGDEFVVLLTNLDDKAIVTATQTEHIGKKILAALCQPYQLSLCRYTIYPSIGAISFDDTLRDTDELMKQADIAMYQAKKAGGKTLYFFDHSMQQTIMDRASLDLDLRQAIAEKDQFQLFYQAQVDSCDRVIGAEALIRWMSPTRGMVSPLDFISIAEESGLIEPIGYWVLSTACQQLVDWAQQPETSHLTLAVNLSAKQIRMPSFVDEVLALLDSTGANPTKLKLEITESILLENMEDIVEKMISLKARGVNFSIDDFGTGYSSLQYLKCLPLDQLKIDQSFVRDLAFDSNDRTIVRTIIAMATSLGLDVIAEGVETEEQLKLLKSKGCKTFQGYLFGKPVPIAEFTIALK